MRLLRVDTSKPVLEKFLPGKNPPYAILSHTWGDKEVSLQKFSRGEGTNTRGYAKILRAASLARRHTYKYIWIDTCCIDKTHHAELAESLNSMYQWYQEAEVCYVFLEDLAGHDPSSRLPQCRWFTRGWTLQELVAPRVLRFYDAEMNFRGYKSDFIDSIFEQTRLPRRILWGESVPTEYSMARRMSWAAGRQTTRTEDLAYCLLGILGVNMPPIYGEGTRAFRRLQEEIVKYNSDMTVLAWSVQPLDQLRAARPSPTPSSSALPLRNNSSSKDSRPPSRNGSRSGGSSPLLSPASPGRASHARNISNASTVSNTSGTTLTSKTEAAAAAAEAAEKPAHACLFAPSPSSFAGSSSLHPFVDDFENFSVTNRGLFVSGTSSLRMSLARPAGTSEPLRQRYVLLVGSQDDDFVGIYLVKIGPDLFQRDWDMDMAVLDRQVVNTMRAILVTDWYILIEQRAVNAVKPSTFRRSAIHIPAEGGHNRLVVLKDAAPTNLWDAQDRVFLRPRAYQWIRYNMVLSLKCLVVVDEDEEEEQKQGHGQGHGRYGSSEDGSGGGGGGGSSTNSSGSRRRPIAVVVICHYQSQNTDPRFVIFAADDYGREVEMLFAQRAPNNSLLWADLGVQCPYLTKLPNYVDVRASTGESATKVAVKAAKGEGREAWEAQEAKEAKDWHRISVSFKKGNVKLSSSSVELYSVHFKVEPLVARRREVGK